jgi:hypothetical protein
MARIPGRPGPRVPDRRRVRDAEAELADAVDVLFPGAPESPEAPEAPAPETQALETPAPETPDAARDLDLARSTRSPRSARPTRTGTPRSRRRRRPLVPGPARDVLGTDRAGSAADDPGGDDPGGERPRRRTGALPLTDPRWAHRDPLGRAVSAVAGVGALWAAGRLGHGRRDRLLWACALAPDLALVIGVRAAPRYVRMPGYAIRPYNALHSPLIPAGLLAVAGLGGGRRVAVAGLAWLGHIALDRAQGYGPRDAEGYVS